MGEKFWIGADLVMEVASGDDKDRRRDLVVKRKEYAKARIAEYWIIDPKKQRILVLHLSGKRYVVHGEFTRGDVAASQLLPGFGVDVSLAFSQTLPTAHAATRRRKKRS